MTAVVRWGQDGPPVLIPVETVAGAEAFAAAMRDAGAEDWSVVGADIRPGGRRLNSGPLTALWGFPRGTTDARFGTLAALERDLAEFRSAGSADDAPAGADVLPVQFRRHGGTIVRLWPGEFA
jgi:hypothetical protein